MRRYNADLANDFGNLVNRTVSMAGRYLGGERPAPRPAADVAAGRGLGARRSDLVEEKLDGCLLHEALGRALGVRRGRQQARRRRAAVGPGQGREGRRRGRRRRGCATSSATSSRPAGWSALAAAPVMPGAAPRVLAQLGYAYPWAADGNGGPPLLDELAWGAHAGEPGTLAGAEPLFPRLEIEAPRPAAR